MATLEKLLKTIRSYDPDIDLDMVKLAYDFALKAHEGQKRLSGEPYIAHPLYTAQMLAEMKLDQITIIAGLLHDVPEETKYEIKDIKKNFGKEVALLVEGVTKLGILKYRGIERYIENLRRMFIAMAQDIRVILIRFADRLHNINTLQFQPPVKQLRIAKETLEIYVPIADRLGIYELKGLLEDGAFKYAYPEEYEWVKKISKNYYLKKEKLIKIASREIEKQLKKEKAKYKKIFGRRKNLYSLYQKLHKYNKDIKKIHDIYALRIITSNVQECYAVLGAIHQNWRPISGRIKDYIAQPKPNGYQSLHTTIFFDKENTLEIQIRTKEMDDEAEHGIAAHWAYFEKKGTLDYIQNKSSFAPPKKMQWVNQLKKWRKELEDNKQYLESLKIDVFQNRIFVFTPKGDVIDLPEDATPVDFAYHVHTEIGDKCGSAMLNGQMTSLDTKLKSGDVVDIVVDKHRKRPNPDWLKFVKTNQARTKIKAATNKQRLARWLSDISE